MKYRTLSEFWDTHKSTRWGQCYGLLILGWVMGVFGALKVEHVSFANRAIYGAIGGVILGVVLNLVLLVPSIYVGFIRRRKAEGRTVWPHWLLLTFYFFPFLPVVCFNTAMTVVNFLEFGHR